jgi:hypothetical protein
MDADRFDAVYVVDADGRGPIRLTAPASLTPAWCPQH